MCISLPIFEDWQTGSATRTSNFGINRIDCVQVDYYVDGEVCDDGTVLEIRKPLALTDLLYNSGRGWVGSGMARTKK